MACRPCLHGSVGLDEVGRIEGEQLEKHYGKQDLLELAATYRKKARVVALCRSLCVLLRGMISAM